MTPDEESFPGEAQMVNLFSQMGGAIQEQLLPQRYIYKMCLWEEVNQAAAEGYEVHPSGPWPTMCEWPDPVDPSITRSGMKPCFLMFRKRSTADDAEEMISKGFPAEFAQGIADGSIPVVEFPNEEPQPE